MSIISATMMDCSIAMVFGIFLSFIKIVLVRLKVCTIFGILLKMSQISAPAILRGARIVTADAFQTFRDTRIETADAM